MVHGLINLVPPRARRRNTALAWRPGLARGHRCPRAGSRFLRRLAAPARARRRAEGTSSRLSDALAALGPSYIKLGQFLATRRDVIGPELARDLANLQDRLPPFPMSQARQAIRDALGAEPEQLFATLGEPIAAASIAQVHKATVREADGTSRKVAVKILRPGVERRFRRDLDSFYFAARQIEAWHPPSRRLRPVAVVDTLADWMRLELDLRLEAAAMSEMAENIAARRRSRASACRRWTGPAPPRAS